MVRKVDNSSNNSFQDEKYLLKFHTGSGVVSGGGRDEGGERNPETPKGGEIDRRHTVEENSDSNTWTQAGEVSEEDATKIWIIIYL